jgi:hypothetical protein
MTADAPVITVTKGSPTPAEIAALVAVLLAARAGGAAAPPQPRRSAWARAAGMRADLPRSWRPSALPR